jgi:hypothetical protein
MTEQQTETTNDLAGVRSRTATTVPSARVTQRNCAHVTDSDVTQGRGIPSQLFPSGHRTPPLLMSPPLPTWLLGRGDVG